MQDLMLLLLLLLLSHGASHHHAHAFDTHVSAAGIVTTNQCVTVAVRRSIRIRGIWAKRMTPWGLQVCAAQESGQFQGGARLLEGGLAIIAVAVLDGALASGCHAVGRRRNLVSTVVRTCRISGARLPRAEMKRESRRTRRERADMQLQTDCKPAENW